MTNQKNTLVHQLLTFFILLGSCFSLGVVDRGILQIEKYAYSSQSLTFLTSCLSSISISSSNKCNLDMKTAIDYSAYTKKWEFTKSITLNNSEDINNNNNNTDTDTSSTTTANNDLFWVYQISGTVTSTPGNSNTTSSSNKISFELDSYEWNNMKIGLFPLYASGSGLPSLIPISNISCIPSSPSTTSTNTSTTPTSANTSTTSAGSTDEWIPIKQYCTLILPPSSTQNSTTQSSHSFAFQIVQMNDPILSMGHFYPTPPPLNPSLAIYQIGGSALIPSSIRQEVIPKVLHLKTGNGHQEGNGSGSGKSIEFRFKSENMTSDLVNVVVEGMPQYGSISEHNGTFTYSSTISNSTSSSSTSTSQSGSSSSTTGSNMDFVYFDFLMNHTVLTRQKVVFISSTPTPSQQSLQQQSNDQIVEKHLDIYLFNSTSNTQTSQTTFEQYKEYVLKSILQNTSQNNYTLLPTPSQTQNTKDSQSQSLMQMISLIIEVQNPIEPSDMECHNCLIHIEQSGHLVNVTYPLLLTSLSDLNIYPISHYSQKGFTIMIPTIPTIPTTTPTTPDTGTTTPGTTPGITTFGNTNSILKLQFSIKEQFPPPAQEPQDGNTEGKRNESLFIFGWILFALIMVIGVLIFIYFHYKYPQNSQPSKPDDPEALHSPKKKEISMSEVLTPKEGLVGAAGAGMDNKGDCSSSTKGMNFVVVSPRISPPPTESLPELPVLTLPQSSVSPTQLPPTVQTPVQSSVHQAVTQQWKHSGIYEYPPQSSYTIEPLHFSTLTTVTEEHLEHGLYEEGDGESSPSVIDYYSEESIMTGITGMTGMADSRNINGSAGIADSGNINGNGFKRPPVPKPRMLNKRRVL